ncbi:hypothetical protein BC826DRAFT_459173 [Russula brevipes]|nr:hypothetical protein BC826DRAFT_459173 [Russula brevipes]
MSPSLSLHSPRDQPSSSAIHSPVIPLLFFFFCVILRLPFGHNFRRYLITACPEIATHPAYKVPITDEWPVPSGVEYHP